jgi:protoporphyrinogen oxidase
VERYRFVVVGAGVSGLSFCNFLDSDDYLILERDEAIGGYCKTVERDGFVWDYSGHFFHFRHPEIEAWLRERMEGEVVTVVKDSRILFKDRLIDFPFQKNIHQLPQDDFIDCLYELYFRPDGDAAESFEAMLHAKFGRGIAERFLVPYNEKLYACSLADLDADAMGRFFPFADIDEIIRNFKRPDNSSYNATFSYPARGAIQYIEALARGIRPGGIALNEALTAVDLAAKTLTTSKGRRIQFEHLVSSAPLDALLDICGLETDPHTFTANKVACFNLGFDRKGWEDVHWVYFPERKYAFYRVGWYDNIMDTDRMSLYVEVGRPRGDDIDMDALQATVLADLETAGVVQGHKLVAHHRVVLDPAYVHINKRSLAAVERFRGELAASGVHPVGRYGGWTYCAIEDNIVETRALAQSFQGGDTHV